MIVFHDEEKLLEWCAVQPGDRLRLVGIDGFTGAGKSSLGRKIAARTAANYVELDKLTDVGLRYVEAMRYGELAQHLELPGNHVVEGIFLQDVLREARVAASLMIYVKRLEQNGRWSDGFELSDSAELNEEQVRPAPSCLSVQVIRYHEEYRPHELADVVFAWTSET